MAGLVLGVLLLTGWAAPGQRIVPRPDVAAEVRREVERRTSERVREGECDHLVYYLLQSRAFTAEAPIEPARSARELVESGRLPETAERRMREFAEAVARPGGDERLRYFRRFLGPAGTAGIEAEYRRAMRSLYEKEFGRPEGADPDAWLAKWYQGRGHSTDTSPEANAAVETALGVIRALEPGARLDKILIVGPGVDFAPRTGFRDRPPRSYQPGAVREALRRLGLSSNPRIQCVDVNERVVEHLRREGIRADRLNILTERYEPAPEYDLVVATNVLLYFDAAELRLALGNLRYLLGPGGWLAHNDLRPLAELLSREIGLESRQARTIRLAGGLVDGFVLLTR